MAYSVTKRYFITLLFTFGRSGLNFITGLLLAKFLGPSDFGTMAFLLGTFLALRQLLDMGTAQAFFTFMSQKIRSKFFVFSYFGWLAIEFFLVILIIELFLPDSWIENIWKGEQRTLIAMAFAATFLQNSVWPSVQQALEAQRKTYISQFLGFFIILCHSGALFTLWLNDELGIISIFIAIFIEYTLALFISNRFLIFSDSEENKFKRESTKDIFDKYLGYCKPLIIYSCLGFLYSFTDTWLLQYFGGSVNQAYYAVSSKFSGIVILATASFINIFYKEIAEAHHQKKTEYLKNLYLKVSRLLFFVGACISCFFMPWTNYLLTNLLGPSYADAHATLIIMFFYPIHQSMGQIGSSFLLATNKVKTQVKLGVIFMVLSIAVSYFVLADKDSIIPGLGLASEGLAMKMIFMQLIQVNVLAYIISKKIKIKFDWLYQLVSITMCVLASYFSHYILTNLYSLDDFNIFTVGKIILGGILYVVLLSVFLYFFPNLAGFKREDLFKAITKIKSTLLGGSKKRANK